MEAIKTHYRTCNLCEAMCGLEKAQNYLLLKNML